MKLTLLKKPAIGTAALAALVLNLNAGTCTVNIGVDYQTIDGFGFSTAWCGQLPTAKNNSLYGTLGMSLLRVRIAENNNWAAETANAAVAHAAGARVFGSPWSPPPEWNSNGGANGGYLLPSHYGDYVGWLNSACSSIGLDYVSIQNEPDNNSWCHWDTNQMHTFVRDYASGITNPVIMPEAIGFNDIMSDPVINDSSAVNNFAILGGHIYSHGPSVHANALAHGKPVWMTEHYVSDTQTDMGNCTAIAMEMSECMNDLMSAYVWWWVNEGDTNVNLVANDGTIFKNGYTIGQFARWVRPGKRHCSATYNPSSDVYVTAYHGGGIVIVAVNAGSSSVNQTFSIPSFSGDNSFAPYRTSASENMAALPAVPVFGNTFTVTLPPQSVTTFNQILTSQPANGTYKFISRNSGKAMDAYGGGTANGTQIIQWTYGGGSNQKWTVTNTGNGYYKIMGVQSGRSLDINYQYGGTANGTKVELWDYWNGPSQQWHFTGSGDGYFRITPNCATGSCLDVNGYSTADGAVVQLWQWRGTANQQWSLQAP